MKRVLAVTPKGEGSPATGADAEVMPMSLIECLNCGATRHVAVKRLRMVQRDECSRCGYVGWAESESLTEALRRALRDHTLEQRRHVVAW